MSDRVDLLMVHASPHEFDYPDYAQMCANRTNHDNGLLGLWVATRDDWIGGFGGHCYEIEVSGRSMDLTVKELWRWVRDGSGRGPLHRQAPGAVGAGYRLHPRRRR